MDAPRPESLEELLKRLADQNGAEEASPHKTPSDARQCLEEAYAARSRDELETALAKVDMAIQLNPGLDGAHNLRGMVLEDLGYKQEALASYREAVRLDPDYRHARENLQKLQAKLTEDDASLVRWYRIGLRAFFRPTQEAMEELLRGYALNRRAPYMWLFFCLAVNAGAFFVSAYLPANVERPGFGYLCLVPILGFVGLIGVGVLTFISQFIAIYLLAGKGTWADLLYIYAAMISPIHLAYGLVILLSLLLAPWIGYLSWVVWVYSCILLAIAVKRINRFGWSRAAIAVLPAIVLVEACNRCNQLVGR